MSKLDDLGAWRIFSSLCRTRNFSHTAAEFDVEISTVSRALDKLEFSLGQELITRNTRPLQLTEVGEQAFGNIEPILAMHREMLNELTSGSANLSGKIRLSLAPGFVARFLMPMLMEFNSSYPEISFDVVGGGNIHDILQYQADIAVVSYKPKDPRLISFTRGRNVYAPVASPEYIAKHGAPQHPRDLKNHILLLYDGSVRTATKQLHKGDLVEPVCWQKVVRVSNILAIKRSVIDGLGISIDMPLLHCADEIASGKLIPIMPGWVNPPVECFLVTSQSNWHIRRHRIFLQWFQERLIKFFKQREEMVAPFWPIPERTLIREG